MLEHPATCPYAGTGEVSRDFINFVADFQSDEVYDSQTAALLCREAYELGRKEGKLCSSREVVTTIVVVAVTLLLLGAHLIVRGL
jgi:hypothetical protein